MIPAYVCPDFCVTCGIPFFLRTSRKRQTESPGSFYEKPDRHPSLLPTRVTSHTRMMKLDILTQRKGFFFSFAKCRLNKYLQLFPPSGRRRRRPQVSLGQFQQPRSRFRRWITAKHFVLCGRADDECLCICAHSLFVHSLVGVENLNNVGGGQEKRGKTISGIDL